MSFENPDTLRMSKVDDIAEIELGVTGVNKHTRLRWAVDVQSIL